jgi:hypothetical protein
VGAWNFVVLGLLAVTLWLLVELNLLGRSVGILPIVFAGAILAVGILNYVPTAFGPAASILGLACGAEFVLLRKDLRSIAASYLWLAHVTILLSPWLSLACLKAFSARPQSPLNACWLEFRNRFGWIWGQRVCEQFNQAAANARWPVRLCWRGLLEHEAISEEIRQEMMATLKALLKRFGNEPG